MLEINIHRGEEGWLANQAFWTALPDYPELVELLPLIERRARLTQATGEHRLWEGYQAVPDYPRRFGPSRTSDQVRTSESAGQMFAWLAAARHARAVVEFGTAFGVSGMYWLAGLRLSGGRLYTFEPNAEWADIAEENLRAISDAVTLTRGTFEENADAVLAGVAPDLAFVDAIHTSDFVFGQLAILKRHLAPGALIVLDDIGFSQDMRQCWATVREDPAYTVSATIGTRIGLVELPRDD